MRPNPYNWTQWRTTAICSVTALVLCALPSVALAQAAFEKGIEGQIWKQLPYVGSASCVPDPDLGYCTEGTPIDLSLGKYYLPISIATDGLPDPRVTSCAADNKTIVYVTDEWNQRVQAFDFCGNPVEFPYTPTLPGPDTTPFASPEGIAVDAAHHIIVVDRDHSRIVVFNADGTHRSEFTVGSLPTGVAVFPGTVMGPGGSGALAVAISGPGESKVEIYSFDGSLIGANPEPENPGIDEGGGLNGPGGVAIDAAGILFVADYGNNRINAYTADLSTGTVTFFFTFGQPADPGNLQPADLQGPYSLTSTIVGSQERLLVADESNQRIAVYGISGPIASPVISFLFYLDARGDLNGSPSGVALDRNGRLYVVDVGNFRIQRFEVPAMAIVDVSATPAGLIPNGSTFTVSAGVAVPIQKAPVANVTPNISVALSNPSTVLSVINGPTGVAPTPAAVPTPTIANGSVAYYTWTYATGTAGGSATFTVGATGDPNAYGPDGVVADPPRSLTISLGCSTCETTPPVTVTTATATASFTGPSTTWYAPPAVVHFSSTDASQVKEIRLYLTGAQSSATVGLPQCADQFGSQIEYCISATPAVGPLMAQISLSAEGLTVVHYRAVDGFGNIEAEQTRSVGIDPAAPIITFTPGTPPNASGWYRSLSVTTDYVITDSQSGVATPTSPIGSVTVSAEGTTTTTIAAIDNVGNNTSGDLIIRIDRTSPRFTAAVVPVSVELTSLAGTPVALPTPVAFDPAPTSGPAGTQLIASGGVVVTSNAPPSGLYPFTPGSQSTPTTVTFTARDLAGNTATTSTTVTVKDTTPPAFVSVPSPALSTTPTAGKVALPNFATAVVATDLNGPVTVSQSTPAGTLLGPGIQTLTFTAVDRALNSSTRTLTFTVADGTPPALTCAGQTISINATTHLAVVPNFAASVVVTDNSGAALAATQVSPAVGIALGVGAYALTFNATDPSGNVGSCQTSLTVTSVPLPTATIALTPGVLWPPNHKLVTVTAVIKLGADPATTVRLVSITSSEPDNGLGDGDTADDIQTVAGRQIATVYATDTRTFKLRAERSGNGPGRIYTAVYRVSNAAGWTLVSATAIAPHDQSGKN